MRKTVVVSAKRTAIGNFGGVFKDISAVKLAVTVAKAIFADTGEAGDGR
jgi:acetyl-CoA C-acetyltransferase